MRYQRHEEFVITSGQATSDSVRAEGCVFGNITLPSAFTGTTLTFQIKTHPSSTMRTVKDSAGVAISLTVAASQVVRIPDECFPCNEIQIVSGSNEGADRTIYCLLSA